MRKKTISTIFSFILLASFMQPKTYALDVLGWLVEKGIEPSVNAICEAVDAQLNFMDSTQSDCRLSEAFPDVNIKKTIMYSVVTLPADGLGYILHGDDADKFGACGVVVLFTEIEKTGADPFLIADEAGNPLFTEDEVDAAKEIVEDNGGIESCDYGGFLAEDGDPGNGSRGTLLGMVTTGTAMATGYAPPVNLAFYAKHNLAKMPGVVGKSAYAQTDLSPWGFSLIIELWEFTRNFAYALMSVIMLVVGFLIITRRKINPQTVVTVQTALPKIVISLLLITFSYPLGALFASLLPILTGLAKSIIPQDVPYAPGDTRIFSAMHSVTDKVWNQDGNVMGQILVLIPVFLSVLIVLFIVFKALIINAKILMSVVFAPIQFALSTIPGQEKLLTNWFKSMFVYVVTIPAMFAVMYAGWLLIGVAATNVATANSAPSAIGVANPQASSSGFTFVAMLLVALFIMFYSLKVEKAIQNFVMGDKRR